MPDKEVLQNFIRIGNKVADTVYHFFFTFLFGFLHFLSNRNRIATITPIKVPVCYEQIFNQLNANKQQLCYKLR